MGRYTSALVILGAVMVVTLADGQPGPAAALSPGTQFISQAALLAGLAPGVVFPFVDTTPNRIVRAHIALTDGAAKCGPKAAPPASVQVLVGQAGVKLVPVLSAATNTGISTTPGQCVFHVTINAGKGGVPTVVTDIAVLNAGKADLTGMNTITVSAEVR